MNAIFVRADSGRLAEIFKKNSFAAIGWLEQAPLNPSSKDELINLYKGQFPLHSKGKMYQNVGQMFRFWNSLQKDDIIVTTDLSNNLLIGQVIGTPYFKKDDLCNFYERIPVKWLDKTFSRKDLSIPAQNTIKSTLTVFNIKQVKEIALLAGINLPDEPNTVIKQKGNLEPDELFNAIKAQLLQLDAAEFESFVAFILQSLGFDAQQRTGKVGDGGIDFEGVLDVMGIASAKLQVQVKQYANAPIGENDIRSFRGALKKDYQGTFITLSKFQKKAIESAADNDKIPVNLIDGKRLVEIFIEQFDKVMELIEEAEGYEMLNKLKFKKTIIPE